jgi:Cathepsin propeptide inhibitor domain (I29)
MEPIDEQEIIFDDDDDDGEVDGVAASATPHFSGYRSSPSSDDDPLRNFQPLDNPEKAFVAENRLKNFLGKLDDDDDADKNDGDDFRCESFRRTTIAGVSKIPSVGLEAKLQSPIRRQLGAYPSQTQQAPSSLASSSFDPYASPTRAMAGAQSLLDISDDSIEEQHQMQMTQTTKPSTLLDVPGAAGYLEMEEEPFRHTRRNAVEMSVRSHPPGESYEPIRTASGLLLTHRKTPILGHNASRVGSETRTNDSKSYRGGPPYVSSRVSGGSTSSPKIGGVLFPNSNPSFQTLANRTLRYVRVWVVLSALVICAGTGILLHHSIAKSDTPESIEAKDANIADDANMISLDHGNIHLIPLTEQLGEIPDRVILLPLPERNGGGLINIRGQHRRLEHAPDDIIIASGGNVAIEENYIIAQQTTERARGPRGILDPHIHLPHVPFKAESLLGEFEAWMARHNKRYSTDEERHRRFQIWSHNHHRTAAKNDRHGPCKLTGEKVFGSNHLQDLSDEEFKSQFLTGYNAKREPMVKGAEPDFPPVLGPHWIEPKRHPAVHARILQQQYPVTSSRGGHCEWWNVSCMLRYIFSHYLYGLGGTMEPAYDAESYPMGTFPLFTSRFCCC